MYKVKYGLAPNIVNELFTSFASTSYSLRKSEFDIPNFNTITYGEHSLRYQGPHIWLKLDNRKAPQILNLSKSTLGKRT